MHTLLMLLLDDIQLRYPHGLPKQHFNTIWDEIGSDCVHAGYSFGQVRDLLIQHPTIRWDNKRMVYRDNRFWIYLDDCPDAAWYSWAGYIWIPNTPNGVFQSFGSAEWSTYAFRLHPIGEPT